MSKNLVSKYNLSTDNDYVEFTTNSKKIKLKLPLLKNKKEDKGKVERVNMSRKLK